VSWLNFFLNTKSLKTNGGSVESCNTLYYRLNMNQARDKEFMRNFFNHLLLEVISNLVLQGDPV